MWKFSTRTVSLKCKMHKMNVDIYTNPMCMRMRIVTKILSNYDDAIGGNSGDDGDAIK